MGDLVTLINHCQILSNLSLRNHHVEELEGVRQVEDMSMDRRRSLEPEAMLRQEVAPDTSGA